MIRIPRYLAIAFIVALLATTTVAFAAKAKPKPKPKPKVKAPAKSASTHHETMGATQLKGATPKFGETWTLGKESPWNVTLNSAEYTTEQVMIGEAVYYPNANEKLLLLHYTVQNPKKDTWLMRFDTLRFTAVDSKDTNWEYVKDIGADKTKDYYKESYSVEMKPTQKADVFTAIIVPAAAVIPKLMIMSSDDLVLRYDMRDKIKGLPAPFADPNDKSGNTALSTVPAKIGVYYPTGLFDIKLLETTTSSSNFVNTELAEGNHWMVAKFTAKNETKNDQLLRFDTFLIKVADQDDAEVEGSGDIYAASRDATLGVNVAPGKEITFRCAFQVAPDQKLKTLTIKQLEEDRAYEYDASSF